MIAVAFERKMSCMPVELFRSLLNYLYRKPVAPVKQSICEWSVNYMLLNKLKRILTEGSGVGRSGTCTRDPIVVDNASVVSVDLESLEPVLIGGCSIVFLIAV